MGLVNGHKQKLLKGLHCFDGLLWGSSLDLMWPLGPLMFFGRNKEPLSWMM